MKIKATRQMTTAFIFLIPKKRKHNFKSVNLPLTLGIKVVLKL